nr:transporter substrate-binding domain-containing protein [Ochrobactrum sp. CM-21-5]
MILFLGAAGTAQADEVLKLKIGTEGANPPLNYVQSDGTLAGFEVEIAKALCEEMKAECEIVAQEWDGAIPAIQSGKFDAFIASMSITEERKKQVDFSDKYFNPPPGIAVPKDSDIKGVTKEDLADKAIGVQISTTHANFAESYFTDSTVKAYPTSQEFRLDLINGRIDAVNDDSVTLAEWVKTPEGACCKVIGTYPPNPQFHGAGVGAAVKKGRPELVEKINAAIKAIRSNGKYKKINDRYFDFDAFGTED